MRETLSSRPPVQEVLFPRTPEVGDSPETIAAQIELTGWVKQAMSSVIKNADRSSYSSEFVDAYSEAVGVSKHYTDHYSGSELLTPELKENMTWQES